MKLGKHLSEEIGTKIGFGQAAVCSEHGLELEFSFKVEPKEFGFDLDTIVGFVIITGTRRI